MNGLPFRETRYSYDPNTSTQSRTHDSARRISRLPTPETSRSSYELFDSDSQEEAMRNGRSGHPHLRPSSDERITYKDAFVEKSLSRRDSCNISTPHSPPYHASDAQKPSLPPLKTVRSEIARVNHPLTSPGIGRQPFKSTTHPEHAWRIVSAIASRADLHRKYI